MFKKARLYSLLAIIVASTLVGLFAFSDTTLAAPSQKSPPSNSFCGGDIVPIPDRYEGDSGPVNTTGTFVLAEAGSSAWNGLSANEADIRDETGADAIVYLCKVGPALTQNDAGEFGASGYLEVVYFAAGTSDDEINAFFDDGFPETTSQVLLYRLCGEASADDGIDQNSIQMCSGTPGQLTEEEIEDGGINVPDEDEGEEEEETPSSCQIKGIGWLICPVVMFLAEVTDASYYILDHTLLRVEPLVLPGGSEGDGIALYDTWKIMRDFANIIFIIGFLIIVFSQITSIGITNYGIKRLLPKIIVAAILVNLSFYICVIAIDLSNILGNSMRGIFDAAIPANESGGAFSFMYTPVVDSCGTDCEPVKLSTWQELTYLVVGGAGVGAAVALTGAALYAFLPVLLPMVIGAVLAVLTIVLALTIRQALIVILVVISPLAFVALLLPNTEDYFKKWRSLFTAMLMVYPIISIVFGASALASRILMATDDFPVQLVGAGVSVIPLFLTPIIMKASGGLLNRWVGLVNNPNKGPIDGMRKNLEARGNRWEGRRKISSLDERQASGRFGKDSKLGRVFGSRYRSAARNDAINSGVSAEASRETNQYVAREIQSDQDFAQSVAGSSNPAARERAEARARSTVETAEREEVKAAHSTIDHLDAAELEATLAGGNNSDAKIAAILERLVMVGDTRQIERAVDTYGGGGQQSIVTSSLAGALQKDGPQWLKASDIDNISRGQMTGAGSFEAMTRSNLADGVMSESKIASDNKSNLEYANKVAADAASAGDTRAQDNLRDTAKRLIRNESLRGTVKHNKAPIEAMAGETIASVTGAASPTATTTTPAGGAPSTTAAASPATTTGASAGTPSTSPAAAAASGTPSSTASSASSAAATPAGWTTRSSGIVAPASSTASTSPAASASSSSTPTAAPSASSMPAPSSAPASSPPAAPAATTAPTSTSATSSSTPAASTPVPAPTASPPSFTGDIDTEGLTKATKDLASRLSNLKMSGDPQYTSEIASFHEDITKALKHNDRGAFNTSLSEASAQLFSSSALSASPNTLAIDIAEELSRLASTSEQPRASTPPPALRPDDV